MWGCLLDNSSRDICTVAAYLMSLLKGSMGFQLPRCTAFRPWLAMAWKIEKLCFEIGVSPNHQHPIGPLFCGDTGQHVYPKCSLSLWFEASWITGWVTGSWYPSCSTVGQQIVNLYCCTMYLTLWNLVNHLVSPANHLNNSMVKQHIILNHSTLVNMLVEYPRCKPHWSIILWAMLSTLVNKWCVSPHGYMDTLWTVSLITQCLSRAWILVHLRSPARIS